LYKLCIVEFIVKNFLISSWLLLIPIELFRIGIYILSFGHGYDGRFLTYMYVIIIACPNAVCFSIEDGTEL
jgi:hypothetical protein